MEELFKDPRLGGRLRVVLGDSRETKQQLANEGPFEGVFIDGAKAQYMEDLKWAEAHALRPGGGGQWYGHSGIRRPFHHVLNHLVMPVIVKLKPRGWFSVLLIDLKRVGILLVIFLGYLYYHIVGETYMLVNMG